MDGELRPGRAEDLPALLAIYNHYVRHSYATFDEAEATAAERRTWFDSYASAGPHRLLVVVAAGRVLGYATSSPYRAHPAFRDTVGTSVYLDPDARGRGLDGQLYDRLLTFWTGRTGMTSPSAGSRVVSSAATCLGECSPRARWASDTFAASSAAGE